MKDCFYCPLLKQEIAEGLCQDINFEREDFVDVGIIKKIQREHNISRDQIKLTCENCEHMPFTE